MLSNNVQTALTEMRQIDVLLDMIIKQFFSTPISKRDRLWFENLETALFLLESTYRQKKGSLITALGEGCGRE